MQKIVISLVRTPERLELFRKNHPEMEFTPLEAVDGNNLPAINIKTSPGWRGPYNNRRILKGEVGCFLSHLAAWEYIANSDQPMVWVMEDDSITPNWINVERDVINMNYAFDMLYLGYNENSDHNPGVPTITKSVPIKMMVEPYNLHSYVLTPNGARMLLEYFNATGGNIIPADDFVCSLISKANQPYTNPRFKVYGLTRPASGQIPRTELVSTIEPTSEDDYYLDFSVHVLTYGTDQSKMNALFDSAAKFSIYPKNLGKGHTWHGGDMTTIGGMQKLKRLHKYIQKLPDHDVVLFTDAYDVFYADDIHTIVKRFLSFNAHVVFGAEKTCWPDVILTDKYPPSPTEYRFLNSGCFIGDVGVLKKILGGVVPASDDEDDQLYLTNVFLESKVPVAKPEFKLALDYEGYIFVVASNTAEGRGTFNQLYNPDTNTCGCIYHGAGGEKAKAKFQEIYAKFKPPINLTYIPGLNGVEIIDRDMLVTDFFTKSQCDAIIKAAESVGSWAPKPGDAYPAQEIRLSLINNLHKYVEERWDNYIVPIIERYFHPLKSHGIRDAFVMKYTVDTQKNLALHNDASMVTGSIKLNDDYTGADLVFPRQGISNLNIPVGKIILFPGQVTHPHECQELTDGTKYSMTIWSKRHPQDT